MNTTHSRSVEILLVEDSPSDALLLQESLSQTALERFDFTHAERLSAAFDLLRQHQFDVLLLDLSLPDSTGRDTFIRARTEAPQMPIVVLTGAEDEVIGLEAVRRGIQDYLIKGESDGRQIARAIRYAIERQRAEEQLRQQAARLREQNQLLELAPVLVRDLEDRIILWDRGAEQLYGWSKAEALGLVSHQRLQTALPRPLEEIKALLFREGSWEGELRHTTKDGTRITVASHWVLYRKENGEPAAIMQADNDITERKRAEQALRENEQRLALLFQSAPVGIVIHAADGRVVRSNATAGQLLGLSEADMQERLPADAVWQFIREDGSAMPQEELPVVQVSANRQPLLNYVVGILRPDTHERAWALTNTVPRFSSEGDLSEIIATFMDITARKQAESILQKAHEELERRVQERTAELSEANRALKAEIAQRRRAEEARLELLRRLAEAQETERGRLSRELHDRLGQELTALKLGLKAVKKHDSGSPAARQCVNQLEGLADSLMRNIHRLAWELRPPVLDDFGLNMALRRYANEWSEHSGVRLDFHSQGIEAGRLSSQLETTLYRVTQEALTNVVRHAHARCASVLLERRPDHVSLIVEDDGQGFDAEAVIGAGGSQGKLGLLGMQERVLLAGGTVDIESTPGRGTTVFVRVPL